MFSFIIPTYQEEKTILEALTSLEKIEEKFEVIIVDSSTDKKTRDKVFEYAGPINPIFLRSESSGRAHQMNIGACASSGDILIFLHADTSLQDNALKAISEKIQSGYIGGAFKIRFKTSKLVYSFISFYANWRAKMFKTFHGDQTQFIRKDVFQKIGGFSDIPLMEDVVLSRKMKSIGPVTQLPLYSTTSPRRIESYGIIKSILRYFFIKILFFFHTSPDKLAKIYNRI